MANDDGAESHQGQEQPVAITTINCSDRLGCRPSAGSADFALCGTILEGKEERSALKNQRKVSDRGNGSGGLLKAAGMSAACAQGRCAKECVGTCVTM